MAVLLQGHGFAQARRLCHSQEVSRGSGREARTGGKNGMKRRGKGEKAYIVNVG
jgi:hypothetical protein